METLENAAYQKRYEMFTFRMICVFVLMGQKSTRAEQVLSLSNLFFLKDYWGHSGKIRKTKDNNIITVNVTFF